jgi:multiple sugar transport system substrate-binding protein
MFRKTILAGMILASALAISSAQAKTIRIAEHRQARIDALQTVVPDIEKKY